MSTEEFSNAFDTALASYSHKAEFGDQASYADVALDEYEKSIFLTQAQDNIVKSYFNGRTSVDGGFDDSTRRQIDFSSLITVTSIEETKDASITCFDPRGKMFKLPSNDSDSSETSSVLFMLNEQIRIKKGNSIVATLVVVPISYKEYDRLMSKPFAQPLKKQAWRLFQGSSDDYTIVTELILKQSILDDLSKTEGNEPNKTLEYYIRYIRRPRPIILENLADGLKIDGTSKKTDCELNPILHIDILEEAVRLALNSKGIETREQKAAREAANRS